MPGWGLPRLRTRCFPARPPHLPARLDLVGFAVLCQLARRDGLSMRFLFVGSPDSASLPPPDRLPLRSWLRVVGRICDRSRGWQEAMAPACRRLRGPLPRTRPARHPRRLDAPALLAGRPVGRLHLGPGRVQRRVGARLRCAGVRRAVGGAGEGRTRGQAHARQVGERTERLGVRADTVIISIDCGAGRSGRSRPVNDTGERL